MSETVREPRGTSLNAQGQGLLAAFLATWRAMLADFGAATLLFIGGIVYSFFYPLPYQNEAVQRVPVAVVDQDRSALSRQLTRYADAHPSLQVKMVVPELAQAQQALWRGEVVGVLLIPADLQQQVARGLETKVQVAGHGIYMLLNKAALNGLAEVVGTVSAGAEIKRLQATTPLPEQAMEQRQPVGVESVPLFNVREGYGAYLVPGIAVMIVQQTLWLAMTLLWGSWQERGAAPAARRGNAAFLGVLLAFASVAFLNCAYYFGFVLWWHEYPRGGNFGGLMFFMTLFSLTAAATGLWLASLFKTRERGMQLLLATAMPLVFVSGLVWPVEALPEPLQALRWLVPSTAGVQGFIALNQLGASLHEVAREVGALLALLVAGTAGAWWRWRKA